MSEFSLDEPESSSHAMHAELGSNHAESSLGPLAVVDTSSKGERVSETANPTAESFSEQSTAENSRIPTPTGSGLVEPAVCKSLQVNVHSLPQGCAVSTSADAPARYRPIDYSKFDNLLDSDEESEHAYTPADLGIGNIPLGRTEAEDMCACTRCHGWAEAAEQAAAGAAAAPLGSNRRTEGSEESPLPGIMSGLRQAMNDSISSSGRVFPAMTAFWFAVEPQASQFWLY